MPFISEVSKNIYFSPDIAMSAWIFDARVAASVAPYGVRLETGLFARRGSVGVRHAEQ